MQQQTQWATQIIRWYNHFSCGVWPPYPPYY